MPTVYYMNRKETLASKNMPVPNKPGAVEAWYKTARVAIPAIPDVDKSSWYIARITATVALIIFEVADGLGQQRIVQIQR